MSAATTARPPVWAASLGDLFRVLAIVIGVIAVVYAINGATQAGASVRVPVQVVDEESDVDVQVAPDGVATGGDFWFTGLDPEGLSFGDTGTVLTLSAWDSTILEQLLARGHVLVAGLAILAGGLLLRPVLWSIGLGRPFEADNARRLTGLAALVAGAGFVAPLLPQIGGLVVLSRLDLVRSGEFSTGVTFDLTPLAVGAVVLAVAAAFRQGARLTRDVEGLV